MTAFPMALVQILPFVTFAFVASITPGPSNLLVLGNSARYGFLAALPIVWGSCAGSAALVLVVGFGVGGWLAAHPGVQVAMGWAGALWMSRLAWQIAFQATGAEKTVTDKPTSGVTAAALQVINPKAWAMALAVVSIFAGADADIRRYTVLSGVFLLVSLPCLSFWAALGARAGSSVQSGSSARAFNLVLGAALLGSAWIGVWEHG
jgi:threonine/homoserine/homoserine lactone efflux protein